MTLRARLVLALGSAALLPMAVTVGVPLLRAGARARAQREARLAASARQADRVLVRERAALTAAVDRAALDATLAAAASPLPLTEDPAAPAPTAFASSSALRELAARHRLD